MSRTAVLATVVGALVAAATLRRTGAALILKTTGTVVRDQRSLAQTAGTVSDGR